VVECYFNGVTHSGFERTTLIIGADLFKQPAVQLSEAKNLLQDFAHIPRAQRLLKVIGKELGK